MLRRILIFGLLAVTVASAQRGGGRSRGGDSNGPSMGFGNTSPFDRVSEMLKLSKDQKRDFKVAMDDAQKEATPLHEQILKSRQSIAEAVAGGKNTEDLVKSEGLLEAQMAEIELRTFTKIAGTLDEEQKPRAGALFMMMRGIFEKKNWNSTDY
jgi:hypothetical protein